MALSFPTSQSTRARSKLRFHRAKRVSPGLEVNRRRNPAPARGSAAGLARALSLRPVDRARHARCTRMPACASRRYRCSAWLPPAARPPRPTPPVSAAPNRLARPLPSRARCSASIGSPPPIGSPPAYSSGSSPARPTRWLIDLAPDWYLTERGLSFSRAERVRVEGARVEKSGSIVKSTPPACRRAARRSSCASRARASHCGEKPPE